MALLDVPAELGLGDDVRLAVKADLRADGTFGEEWMVVTRDRLMVFARNLSGYENTLSLPLEGLSDPKAQGMVGGGVFEVAEDGMRHQVVRYTNARAPRFAMAAGVLEKWLKSEEAAIAPEEDRRCPRCGIPREVGVNTCSVCTPRTRTLQRLMQYASPYWKLAIGLSALSIGMTALGLLPPYLQKPLMDRVLVPQGQPAPVAERMKLLGLLVLALLIARILIAVISIAQGWLSAFVGNKITHDIRCKLYEHLQFTPLSFFDKRQIGTVISRVNQDTGQLQAFLVWAMQDIVTNILLLLGIGAVMFVMNWKLALLVLVPAPAVAALSSLFWKRIRNYMRRVWHQWGRVNAVLNESLTGLKVVKACAQEQREIGRFVGYSDQLAMAGVRAERMWSTLFSGLSLVIMLGTLLVWYVGGRNVLLGGMTPGTMVAFLSYVAMFYGPVQFLSMLLNWSSRSLTAAERVFEILDTRLEVLDRDKGRPMPHIEGRIDFEDVTFGYDVHNPALKHVSFSVEPGEMIGLVGHSGAGKSTTINLLCRFYEANEGRILIDGVPITEISVDDLRGQIGLVPQDTFLFNGTIAENISYAKPSASEEEIIRAAKIANAHDFIRQKPDGYETLIGEGGQGVSAGERQRLAIARAVLHNPRILILDEATSQVDVETERQIQEAIDRLIEGRTTIAIAHRLSTLKNADRLLVLKKGEIAESGTHDELMAIEDGEFHKLVKTYQEISKVRSIQR